MVKKQSLPVGGVREDVGRLHILLVLKIAKTTYLEKKVFLSICPFTLNKEAGKLPDKHNLTYNDVPY